MILGRCSIGGGGGGGGVAIVRQSHQASVQSMHIAQVRMLAGASEEVVSDLGLVGGFCCVLRFSAPKLASQDYDEN